jgi:hypothetical protein
MDNFWPWLIVASLVGLMLWRQSRKREMALTPDEIVPVLVEKVCLPMDRKTFEEEVTRRLESFGLKLMTAADETTRYVFDQPRAGWFHWGFFYTVEISESKGQELALSVGIYPKGPNPPRGARLKKHLHRFVTLITSE